MAGTAKELLALGFNSTCRLHLKLKPFAYWLEGFEIQKFVCSNLKAKINQSKPARTCSQEIELKYTRIQPPQRVWGAFLAGGLSPLSGSQPSLASPLQSAGRRPWPGFVSHSLPKLQGRGQPKGLCTFLNACGLKEDGRLSEKVAAGPTSSLNKE